MILLICLFNSVCWILVIWGVGAMAHWLKIGGVSWPWVVGAGVVTFVGSFIGLAMCGVGKRMEANYESTR